MRTMKLAAVAVLLVAAPTFGATLVAFELELGGDNQGARCPAGGAYYFFLPGDTADGNVYAAGQPLTWGVRVAVSGDHDGNATPGVANFVFNLELHEGAVDGPLVAQDFYSTTQDGNGGCVAASGAFAYTMNGFSAGPARVIDYLQGPPHGGVRMDVFTYPTDPADGTLLGMGAGYSRWVRSGGYPEWSVAGVGRTAPPCDPTVNASTGMGVGPVCEGQIDTTGLSQGVDYYLVVKAGAGVNVLRGDKNLGSSQNSFAIAADATQDDAIRFQVGEDEGCEATLTGGWYSYRQHGIMGEFEIALDPAATGAAATTESRDGGLQKLEVDMTVTGDAPTLVATVTAAKAGGGNFPATTQGLVDNGGGSYTLVAEWNPALASPGCYTISLAGVLSCDPVNGDLDCMVRVLTGDTNGDGSTNAIDKSQVAAMNGQPLLGNQRFDVNADGSINSIDKSQVASLGGTAALCP